MRTHDLGRAFWCRLKLRRGTPLLHRAPMRQGVWPYLQGRTVILRVGGEGLALGWWTPADPQADEQELMLTAMGGRVLAGTGPATISTDRGVLHVE